MTAVAAISAAVRGPLVFYSVVVFSTPAQTWPGGNANVRHVQEDCVFVKRFRSHKAAVAALAISPAGDLCATACADGSAKVYDVATFDMIAMLRLPFVPGTMSFLSHRRATKRKLAVSERDSGRISVFEVDGDKRKAVVLEGTINDAPGMVPARTYIAQVLN